MSTLSTSSFTSGRVLRRRYRLETPLIIGSTPELWLGVDLVLQRPVRIKLLHPDLARDETFATRLHDAAIAAARLTHPHVAPTYDTGQEDDTTFIVAGHLDGRTLTEIMASGPLDPRAAVTMVKQVAEALDYAHNSGVVHGDITPDNIVIVGGDHRVVVSDFGIAKAVAETPEDALGGSQDAKLRNRYTAPEQCKGEQPTSASDIWAIGTLLNELTHGNGENEAASQQLNTTIERATAENPEDRFDSAGDIARQLRSIERPSTSRYLDDNWPNQKVDHFNSVSDPTVANRRVMLPAPVAPQNDPTTSAVGFIRNDSAHDTGQFRPTSDNTNPAGEWPTAETPVVNTQSNDLNAHATQAHHFDAVEDEPFNEQPKHARLSPELMREETIHRAHEKKVNRRYMASAAVLAAILLAVILGRVIGSAGDNTENAAAPVETESAVSFSRASAFDPPPGDGDENSAQANNAIDDNPQTFWSTQTYSSPRFGNLKRGIGLVLRTSRPAEMKTLEVDARNQGWSAQIYVANSPGSRLTEWGNPVDTQSGLGQNAQFDLHNAQGSAVLIWFTNLGDSNRLSVVEAKLNNG